jgi:hypothetical protein
VNIQKRWKNHQKKNNLINFLYFFLLSFHIINVFFCNLIYFFKNYGKKLMKIKKKYYKKIQLSIIMTVFFLFVLYQNLITIMKVNEFQVRVNHNDFFLVIFHF